MSWYDFNVDFIDEDGVQKVTAAWLIREWGSSPWTEMKVQWLGPDGEIRQTPYWDKEPVAAP